MFFDASRSELKVAKVEIDALYKNEKIARNIGAVMKVQHLLMEYFISKGSSNNFLQ